MDSLYLVQVGNQRRVLMNGMVKILVMPVISWLPAELLTSRKGLGSMDLVCLFFVCPSVIQLVG